MPCGYIRTQSRIWKPNKQNTEAKGWSHYLPSQTVPAIWIRLSSVLYLSVRVATKAALRNDAELPVFLNAVLFQPWRTDLRAEKCCYILPVSGNLNEMKVSKKLHSLASAREVFQSDGI